MGSGKPYLFTQASVDNNGMGGSLVIEGNSALTDEVRENGYVTTNTLGDYHVKQTIGAELYDYNVVLYKRGNAHAAQTEGETEVLDVKDLVAVKKALLSESEFSKAELKAADCNVDGTLDEYDADFLRKALVNEWNIMTAAEAETVLDQGTMPIVGYNGPGVEKDGSTTRLTESVYSLIKEMGFNTVVTPTVDADTTTSYKKQSYPVLDLAQKYGIKVWLNDSVIAGQEDSTTTAKELLAARTGQYDAFESFAGFYMEDDLSAGYGAEAIVYANYLRPDGQETGSYELAVEDFYKQLKEARIESISEGKPFQAFVQSGTDFSDSNATKTEQANLTTRQEMYLEVNAALAMGAKGIYYYNLMQEEKFAKSTDKTVDSYRNGLINVNGEANHGENSAADYDYFDTAKTINSYVAEIDMVLMNAESKGVITTDTTVAGYIDGVAISSYGAVKRVSGEDAFVGCFDYYGKDTYLVVNKSVTTQQSITLDFGEASRTYVTTDMSLNKATKSGTSVTLEIAAGESVLVVLEPFENQKTVLRATSPKNGEIAACASETVTGLTTDYTPKKSDDGSAAQRTDTYQRKTVTLTWSGNADSYTIILSVNRNMSDARKYAVSGTSLQLENLLADKNYYWQISDGESTSAVYNFHTQKTVRTLTIDSISNTRDIGGYMTSSGKTVKQGMVYRGARLDSISSTGKTIMLEELSIQTDLDLRGDGNLTKSPLGEKVNFVYVKAPSYIINDASYNDAMAEAIRIFTKKENYPIYMHCSIGRDRTGTVSFLINALLGVQKNDLYMDYELSFLSSAATGDLVNTNISGLIDKYFTNKLYNYVMTFSKDGTIQSGAEQYMLSIGITQEEIAAIRTLMLE